MVTPSPASIVVMPFPFSDLSSSKLRPALVVASADKGDWLLCQITSKQYSDPNAVKLETGDLDKGSLNLVSYVRPMKLFTANQSLMVKRVAVVNDGKFTAVLDALIRQLEVNRPK